MSKRNQKLNPSKLPNLGSKKRGPKENVPKNIRNENSKLHFDLNIPKPPIKPPKK